MSNVEDHATAIAVLNELELDSQTIFVSESMPKKKTAGSKTSVYGTPRSKNDVYKTEL